MANEKLRVCRNVALGLGRDIKALRETKGDDLSKSINGFRILIEQPLKVGAYIHKRFHKKPSSVCDLRETTIDLSKLKRLFTG